MTTPSDSESSTAPVTETTFVATAAGTDDPPPPVRGSVNRVIAWILPANFSIFLIWGAVPTILLAHQVELLDSAHKVANLAIVSTIGAFCAMVAQPVAGQISDRTRSRFGRRAPWMMFGVLVGGLALVGLGFANSLIGIAIAWPIVQIAYNFTQGPLSAVLPDRIPVAKRGTFSAVFGVGLMAGALGGQILGAMLYNSLTIGYVCFALFAVIVIGLFILFNPDHSSKNLTPEPFDLRAFLATFWVNPIAYPDFFWAFTGRLLLYVGYFAIMGYQLYILTDYLGIAHPESVIPMLSIVALVGTVIATIVSGPLSDKVGRRKPFVFGSSLVICLALILPWVWPTLTSWTVMVAIMGLGFGMYQAVDTALISEVLPSAKSFAKDLGVVNIAATLPQTLAPAVAGAIVLLFGYVGLFPVGIVLAILGAFAVWPIKAVR